MSFFRSGSRPTERSFDLLSFKSAPFPVRTTGSRLVSWRLLSERDSLRFSFVRSLRDPRKSLIPATFIRNERASCYFVAFNEEQPFVVRSSSSDKLLRQRNDFATATLRSTREIRLKFLVHVWTRRVSARVYRGLVRGIRQVSFTSQRLSIFASCSFFRP